MAPQPPLTFDLRQRRTELSPVRSSGTLSPTASEVDMSLKDRIKAFLCESKFDGSHEFLPYDKLQELSNEDAVLDELYEDRTLKKLSDETLDDIKDFIVDRARCVFLTLAFLCRVSKILDLRAAGFDDQCLPIVLEQAQDAKDGIREIVKVDSFRNGRPVRSRATRPFRYQILSWNSAERKATGNTWKAFHDWDENDLELFVDKQWLFLAPVFEQKSAFDSYLPALDTHLHPRQPLPFVSKDLASEKAGFFSVVCQYKLHPAHARNRAFSTSVAVKEMKQLQGVEVNYKKELETLQILQLLDNPHIIKPIAAFNRGEGRCYFMFPWAEGGNLREYWRNNDPIINKESVLWAIEQMSGLAGALWCLYERNGRHGDLKPENILIVNSRDGKRLLQLADMGLAKFHVVATNMRFERTSTRAGTFKYEPPEANHLSDNRPTSRDYDVWSMGCVYLEFLIWLLYGQVGLANFHAKIDDGSGKFWQLDVGRPGRQVLNSTVETWICQLEERLRVAKSLAALLNLVRSRMLLIKAEEAGPAGRRADATELRDSIAAVRDLFAEEPQERYVRLRQHGRDQNLPTSNSLAAPARPDIDRDMPSSLPLHPSEEHDSDIRVTVHDSSESVESMASQPAFSGRRPAMEYNDPELRKLNDVWDSKTDNKFASDFLGEVALKELFPASISAELCDICRQIDFWEPLIKISVLRPRQTPSGQTCAFCKLIWDTVKTSQPTESENLSLSRIESTLRLKADGPPLLSIYPDPLSDGNAGIPSYAQLGIPVLPEHGGQIQLGLFKKWLQNCDDGHRCTAASASGAQPAMPTRLIDVGKSSDSDLRLVEEYAQAGVKYCALSHCWGNLTEQQKFCTYRSNHSAMKHSIDLQKMPRTFQDAVTVTRALGLRYLWIDSLCIIQDDSLDWEAESERMEDVFSSAYVTIAATSARSSLEGFLGDRRGRGPGDCVKLLSEKSGTLYVCKAIDDFHKDVENGPLNQRGWVLQERVLSRRSIHFTSSQVYWECGEGVHCETLARLRNSKAAILGDSRFPDAGLGYFKNDRIECFQMMYEMYSGLGFSKQQDRSVGIAGLEKRLVRSFSSKGGYGVFEAYLARGLLWQRPSGGTLRRIAYKSGVHVPSWSWMAYSGAIEYLKFRFADTDWTEDFKSPFKPGASPKGKLYWGAHDSGGVTDLRVRPHKILPTDLVELYKRIRHGLDEETPKPDITTLRCVILGKQRLKDGDSPAAQLHYVLVIKPILPESPEEGYMRAGVAHLLPAHISMHDPEAWVCVR